MKKNPSYGSDRNKTSTIDELKTEIKTNVLAIGTDILEGVFQNLIKRINARESIGGGHFKHILSYFYSFSFPNYG